MNKVNIPKKIEAINASLRNPKRRRDGSYRKPWVLQVPPIEDFRFKVKDQRSFFITCMVIGGHAETPLVGLGASKRSMKDQLNRPLGRALACNDAVRDYLLQVRPKWTRAQDGRPDEEAKQPSRHAVTSDATQTPIPESAGRH